MLGASADTGTGVALSVQEISKSFASTRALKGVSFEVRSGEIHALLGGNGSGKSTLVKILAGVHDADGGSVEVHGDRLDAEAMTPAAAQKLGLRFVHQQPSTFPELSVAENLSLGRGFETGAGRNIRWRAVRDRSRAVLHRFGIDVDPREPLSSLGAAEQKMVEIARALQDQEGASDGILVLDEPTASLPAPEVAVLLDALKRYAAQGQTIIYVTHRLEEVLDVGDRVTVLRDGDHVATVPCEGLSHDALVELIVGRSVESVFPETAGETDDRVVLDVRGLRGGPVRSVDLTVHAGEILGLAGLVGSGRTSLLRMLFGDLRPEAGEVWLDGKLIAPRTIREAMQAGIAYVPETRSDAAFADMTLAENLSAASVSSYWRGGRLRSREERTDTLRLIDTFAVKAQGPGVAFGTLSGGNQQKAILGRWLRREPRVLLLDEPTHGVDVGARIEIYATIRRAVDLGAAVLVVSSDFEELAGLCDRVAVLAGGSVVAEATGPELESGRLQQLAYAIGADDEQR
ncbi:MAG: transporter related protein [Solirubrobacterales bacterium]|jgi:ribose transport system ATP-binding protein|nr:transporter related protein [Solirubrobacterales bacterium]